MCLRLVFLLVTRIAAWLRLSRREEAWKTAEILLLCHQLAVLQRRQPRRPKLNWADRALIAALLSVMPKARRHGLRLLVTPETILRWHRDIVRRHWAARSMRGKTGRPATRRNIQVLVRRLARENPGWDTAGSTANWRAWASKSQRRPCGRSSRPAALAPPGG
jgi:putative transposase